MIGCVVLFSRGDGVKSLFSTLFKDREYLIGNAYGKPSCLASDWTDEVGTGCYAFQAKGQVQDLPIPARYSNIYSCVSGTITNADEVSKFTGLVEPNDDSQAPAKLLARLNSTKHDEMETEGNYADLVKSRVVNMLRGVWAVTMAYTNPSKTSFVIASQHKNVYFYFVYSKDTYALIWSDREDLYQDLCASDEFFVYCMCVMDSGSDVDQDTLANGKLLVIHPLFLVTKWKRWKTTYKDSLPAVAALERYLIKHVK